MEFVPTMHIYILSYNLETAFSDCFAFDLFSLKSQLTLLFYSYSSEFNEYTVKTVFEMNFCQRLWVFELKCSVIFIHTAHLSLNCFSLSQNWYLLIYWFVVVSYTAIPISNTSRKFRMNISARIKSEFPKRIPRFSVKLQQNLKQISNKDL